MHELIGTIQGISIDYQTGDALLTISTKQKQSAIHCYDQLRRDEKLSIKIDKYRKKRSLNANAYCWKLLTEIADILRLSKEEVYVFMLKRYGQREVISVLADIPAHEYIRYLEEFGESELNGKLFKHYYVYKGSSDFDTREMSIFLDGIVQEAKELGIQTETPDQIAKMKALWGE